MSLLPRPGQGPTSSPLLHPGQGPEPLPPLCPDQGLAPPSPQRLGQAPVPPPSKLPYQSRPRLAPSPLEKEGLPSLEKETKEL
ncbi:hypothetical protein GUJ93_ZPchr0003g18624 [Zizania palustris]|uniref:Uncharacterized protein n=1 Tax=Zizania palustris TaxID=103762 RepID=A0A8J5S6F1_ZIZPA|nr:hypothetical protein GUJ93_ZPchr0003g18624 [Zizania palustris]